MSRQITPERIAQFKQYWRDGFSLPEIASMCKSSVTTIRKYLKSDIDTYIDEHKTARARRDILPNDNQIMIETQIEQVDNEQFIKRAEQELLLATNIDEAKESYLKLKPEAIINITRVESFRAIYERTLERISKPKTVDAYRLEWSQEVEQLNGRFNAGIKTVNKKSHLTWTQERYLVHLYYWLRLKSANPKDWMGTHRFLKLESDEERRSLINELIETLEIDW